MAPFSASPPIPSCASLSSINKSPATTSSPKRNSSCSAARWLCDAGWEIGAHTVGHVVLTHEPPARIKHELQNKGLGAELLADAMDSLKATELERAREVWRKKFDGPAPDAAGRAKQMRFLAARGFGGDVIRRVVSQAEED